LHVGEGDALGPIVHRLGVGPARRPKPTAKVVEDLVAHVNPEGLDLRIAHGKLPPNEPDAGLVRETIS
jgi:hypothetical protein